MPTRREPFWKHVQVSLTGEVSTDGLKMFRQAGASVYELMEFMEQRRFLRQNLKGAPAPLAKPEQQAALCTWNAFALQTLGDALLGADTPPGGTVGFLPAVTAEQARRYFMAVTGWLKDAHLSYADATFQPAEPIPASLPDWVDSNSCPADHVAALTQAMTRLSAHLSAAALDFEQKAQFLGFGPVREELLGRVEAAEAQANYARDLFQPPLSQEAQQTVQELVQQALEAIYLTGQVLYMPALLPRVRQLSQSNATSPASGPSSTTKKPAQAQQSESKPEPGIRLWKREPWCISDPRIVPLVKGDSKMLTALREMWQQLREPERAYQDYLEVLAAFDRDDLQFAIDGQRKPLGHDHEPPFGAVYIVVKDCTLLGKQLNAGQMVLMSRGPGRGGREFRMLAGEFESAPGVEYQDVRGPEDGL